MAVKKILALLVGFSLILGVTACDFLKKQVPVDLESQTSAEATDDLLAKVPSDKEIRIATEQRYNTIFYIVRMSVSTDGNEAEWVLVSRDGTLEVTVTWNTNDPDELDYSDRGLSDFDVASGSLDFPDNQYSYGQGSETIRVFSYTSEVPEMIGVYMDKNPAFGKKYKVEVVIIPADSGTYQTVLSKALLTGENKAPDIYLVDSPYAAEYTKGDMARCAASYWDLGIDIDNMIEKADIADYVVNVGTRKTGEVVALGYQSTSGAMIYRASIAREVFGTDDPDEIEKIMGAGTGKWDNFLDAAKVLKSKGYSIVAGLDDLCEVCNTNTSSPWLDSDSNLVVSPEREEFFDLAKTLIDEGYTDGAVSWTESWYKDMQNSQVFCYFGSTWLINWVMAGNCGGTRAGEGTYGDWRVCLPPVGFFWGGSWILANKNTKQKEGVAELITWFTLDTSENGLQYLLANDKLGYGSYESVVSNTVMAESRYECGFCGGQDIFKKYSDCNRYTSGNNMYEHDIEIYDFYYEAVKQYANGNISRDDAIRQFKDNVDSYDF